MRILIRGETCRDLESAIRREWLVTNGLGGYASGTVAGVNTRRYHGLLVASCPPLRRVVLVAAVEEWLIAPEEEPRPLSAQEYWDGTVFPDGYKNLDEVRLDGMLPVFRWTVAGRTIEKRIWMEHGQNRTVVTYRLIRGKPARLRLQPLFAHRDYHQHRRGPDSFDFLETRDGWTVRAAGVTSHVQATTAPEVQSRPDWYWRFLHRDERDRGLDDEEDLFTPGAIELTLSRAAPATLVMAADPLPTGFSVQSSLLSARRRHDELLAAAGSRSPLTSGLVQQLVLAAEQFRVMRVSIEPPQSDGKERTIVAGYHWFTDWGRDTMISLPGLYLVTGQPAEARDVLVTFVSSLDQGMLPNVFSGEETLYNTIDATLWLFQSLHAYAAATADWPFIRELLPRLEEVIRSHVVGTRYQIRMDPSDGLLAGGEEGVALTWMDAKVLDWVVSPRRGKPIEVNALWYNALRLMADWRCRAGLPFEHYSEMASQARAAAVQRFWYAPGGYLYDVIDGPEGDDSTLRPNQVLALGLVYPLFEGEQAKSAFETVTAQLLTPVGLRTLSPKDPRFQPHFGGDQRARDGAYHMGTVWPWLLGPYLDAHYRIYRDRAKIRRLLQAFVDHLSDAGLGTISEIFEPEPPFRPAGCIAQAWSVAEILRHAMTAQRRRRASKPAASGSLPA